MAATAITLVEALIANRATITTAESCTGGLIAAAITDISGSSSVFHQGVVSYANEAKITLLGVSSASLKHYGAVSAEVAKEMAEGARASAKADVAIAATGVAGPTGGTPEKPVGLVFIAVATKAETKVEKHVFVGDRKAIRKQVVEAALKLAISFLP